MVCVCVCFSEDTPLSGETATRERNTKKLEVYFCWIQSTGWRSTDFGVRPQGQSEVDFHQLRQPAAPHSGGCGLWVCPLRCRDPVRLESGWWLVGWLFGWLAGWLVGWLAGWLVGWLAGWLVGWLAGWLFGWANCLGGSQPSGSFGVWGFIGLAGCSIPTEASLFAGHLAMGQNPLPPVNIPLPTK